MFDLLIAAFQHDRFIPIEPIRFWSEVSLLYATLGWEKYTWKLSFCWLVLVVISMDSCSCLIITFMIDQFLDPLLRESLVSHYLQH